MAVWKPDREAIGALIAGIGLNPSTVVEFPALSLDGTGYRIDCEIIDGGTITLPVSDQWARDYSAALWPPTNTPQVVTAEQEFRAKCAVSDLMSHGPWVFTAAGADGVVSAVFRAANITVAPPTPQGDTS